jgi:hypothetical protein
MEAGPNPPPTLDSLAEDLRTLEEGVVQLVHRCGYETSPTNARGPMAPGPLPPAGRDGR